ncbi:acetyl-CoA carboxylase biotin carboxyl carrier protein [Peribacillus cavernae]|uniref:Biotin carboxyl carrier protein of acetyl-CoA carboxylase n=1 Tax=Peribacillus cavernae TaxID=1674310 RepID=A0A3S1B0R9_9BACI|nr:acetyl-CoA carboxylase biotin carboxyl carrier protein [Peribacillus cavernae]MDQ0220804.1 acetyl-CoA carboxylase biotin carboxyl carrier protein [Peribacillus cavernae]RUQ24770.1 acetyl-CoA carboxylase biotin carboxyl carrier protein [Peribacillus cavernae]
MLKIQEIRELIKLVDQSSINEFVYEQEGTKIKMKKTGQEQPVSVVYQPAAEPVQSQVQPVQPAAEPVKTAVSAAMPDVEKQEVNQDNLHKITSPMVGTFYQSPSPDTDAYVKAGSKVNKDSVVCIVEAMKLFNEIEAEVEGEIVEILVKDGQLIEYGQPLYLVKPE